MLLLKRRRCGLELKRGRALPRRMGGTGFSGYPILLSMCGTLILPALLC